MNNLTQIPQDKLVEGRWYVGRGRNANVARWVRIGKNPSRLTFVTVGMTGHEPVVKGEGYYKLDAEDGCFQPFVVIDEGTVVESVGTEPGWPQHYAKVLTFEQGQQDSHSAGR